MRKSAIKEKHPDRMRRPAPTPLMAALSRALKSVPESFSQRFPQKMPTPAASIRFETLEPRILLSGDVNPAALSVAGGISVPGEQDQYEFTVAESRRVVFDSLTNRSDLNWKLGGADGLITSRDFNSTDYNASSPAFELTPGKYTLTVDGSNDATGSYALRLIDADAAADMLPGSEVSGILDGGNKTAVYRFSAKAGDKFYFSGSTDTPEELGVDWRLIDPFGRQEGDTDDLRRDQNTFAVQRTGEYLFLVEGAASNSTPVAYRFNLRIVSDSTQQLPLDSTATALIDQVGKAAHFTFNLSKETPVLFESLTSSGYYWSLTGPKGVQVDTSEDEDYLNGSQRLLLAAGAYTLTVTADGATTGAYDFRLLTDTGAQRLEPGVAVNATLDNARGMKIYKVALNAGDKVFLDESAPTVGAINWRLINPFGGLMGSGSLSAAREPLTMPATGDYWLVMEGADSNAADASVAFALTLNKVVDVTAALSLGTAVSGNIEAAGQTMVYTFDIAQAGLLVFDAHSSRSDLVWSLSGPRGAEITSWRFDQSDAGNGPGVLAVPAGGYRLSVRGTAGAKGSFGFNLLNLNDAPAATVGTPLIGTLTPGNSSQAHKVVLAAGDKLTFQSNSVSAGAASWRLLDRFGRDVAGVNNLSANRTAFKVLLTGAYTLLIEGQLNNTEPLAFNVQLNPAGNEAPVDLPAGDALRFDSLLAGTLADTNASKVFRFSLSRDQLLIMDTQTPNNSSAVWSLLGPRGTEIDKRLLYSSDSQYSNPLLNLIAGDYALVVKGGNGSFSGNGAYSFKLLDALALPALTLGQQTVATRSPSNATVGYQFEATAGSKLVLNWTESDSNKPTFWTLVDPFGRRLAATSGDNPGSTYAIEATGAYTLLNEVYYYNSTGSSGATFTLSLQDVTRAPLALNHQLSGVLAGRQSLAQYDFILNNSTTLVFDALDNTATNADNLQWVLRGPGGRVFGQDSLTASNANAFALAPGQYSFLLRNTKDAAASYKFRLLDRAAAALLTPGEAVNDSIPAGESRLYRFNANAGERYAFDGQNTVSAINEAFRWWLLDPFGDSVASGVTSDDENDIPLYTSGEYLLFIYPSTTSQSPPTVKFNLYPTNTPSRTLTLGQDIEGSIARPWETVNYDFTLDAPARLLVEGWNSSFQWSMTGPRGSEASDRTLNGAMSVFNLPAGSYRFSVTDDYAYAPGAFHFRISDLGAATQLPLDTPIHLELSAGDRSLAYRRFDLSASAELGFEAIGSNNAVGNWTIFNLNGNSLANGSFSSDSARFILPEGGYTLVMSRPGGVAANVDFALRQAIQKTVPLVLATRVSDTLLGAQVNRYTFEVAVPTAVLFEGGAAGANLRWQLVGPSGETVSSSSGFNVDGQPIRLSSAGKYTVRVWSDDYAGGDFSFRLLDINTTELNPLSGNKSITLSPQARTQILAFNSVAGDYFSYQPASLSNNTKVFLSLVDAFGNVIVPRQDAAQGLNKQLASAGRYYLLWQADAAIATPLEITFRARMAQNRSMPLTIGSDSLGSIDAPGFSETWNFTLDTSKRLLLDGLSGQQMSWRLNDAMGNSLQSGTLADSALFGLVAGRYSLSITSNSSANGTVPGSYGFRLVDTVNGVALADNSALSDVLPATHTANIYRFSLSAGERRYLQANAAGSGGRVTVIDLQTSAIVGASPFPLAGVEVAAGSSDRDFLVVVDSDPALTAPLAYTLVVYRTQEQVVTAPGDLLVGHIAAPNEYRAFRFNLSTAQRLIVSDAGSDAGMRWRLTKVGESPGNWQTFPADRISSAVQSLSAGEWILTLANTNADGGDFRVQWLNLDAAPVLPATSVQLAHGRDAIAYAFTATNNQRLTIGVNTVDPQRLAWALYDPSGNPVVANASGVAGDTGALSAGRHVLVLFGKGAFAEPIDTTIHLAPPVAPATLVLGETVHGALTGSNLDLYYPFTLSEKSVLLFDALYGDAALQFNVPNGGYGPFGPYYDYGTFGTDATISSRWVNLAAGSYSLIISRTKPASVATEAVPFGFRLLTPAQARGAELLLDTPLDGTLASGREVVAHHIRLSAGDVIAFTENKAGAKVTTRLMAPDNSLVSASNGNYPITFSGFYTLLVDGNFTNPAPVDYQIAVRLISRTDLRPADPPFPLLIGATTSATISTPKTYSFSLAQTSLLALSGRINSGAITWSISGVENSRLASSNNIITSSDTFSTLVNLAAGDYALTFTYPYSGGGTAGVEFLLEDAANAQPVLPGSDIVSQGLGLFKLTLQAGERFFYRSPLNARWEIWGGGGTALLATASANSSFFSSFTAPQSGDYFILLKSPASAADPKKLELRPWSERLQSLELDQAVAGGGGLDGFSTDTYTFTLAEARRLMLDLQQLGNSVKWQLSRDAVILAEEYFDINYPRDDPLFSLAAGNYRLTLTRAYSTSSYRFVLRDLALAPLAILDGSTTVNQPPGEAVLRRFSAQRGDSFIYRPTSVVSSGKWRLLDAANTQVGSGYKDEEQEIFNLPADGVYSLIWDNAANSAVVPVANTFDLRVFTPILRALPGLNQIISNTLEEDGRLRYRFHVDGDTTLLLDQSGAPNATDWEILDGQGRVVVENSFNDYFPTRSLAHLDKAGDYLLGDERRHLKRWQAGEFSPV